MGMAMAVINQTIASWFKETLTLASIRASVVPLGKLLLPTTQARVSQLGPWRKLVTGITPPHCMGTTLGASSKRY